jgi:N-acetylglucosaminyldiphosphoundecaprenol N-acetyl-beta-D-mannosaminyltransferase
MDPQARLNRVSVLGVPVDILPPEGIEDLVARFEDGMNHQIVLLSLWDLMRARRAGEFRTMIAGASLVLPISLAITRGARFLRRAEPLRYMPFDFVVKLLGALEQRGKSVYILGSTRTSIQKAEGNIKSTFPGLRLVGRYAGRYPKQMEGAIVEAVKKATPSLLLVGAGVDISLVLRSLRGFRRASIQALESPLPKRPRVDTLFPPQAVEIVSCIYLHMV